MYTGRCGTADSSYVGKYGDGQKQLGLHRTEQACSGGVVVPNLTLYYVLNI